MSSSKKPTASSQLPYIPSEIWTQIFPKLPAKTILKLRCVCKCWRSIIDNPDFVHIYFQHSQINSENNKLLLALEGMGYYGDEGCLLTLRDAQTLGTIDYILSTHSDKYRILSSCNGLLLVGLYSHYGYLKELRLWNPCIRKSLIIPICPFRSYHIDNGAGYVLGFASDSQEYKVVGFAPDDIQGKQNGNMNFAVYTLCNQQWTVRKDPLNVPILSIYDRCKLFNSLSTAVFFRGAAYWLGKIDNQWTAFTHLASFDFDQEKLSFLELPFTCEAKGTLRFLFLLSRLLAVFSISKVSSSIWVLEQDNKNGPWTQWFSGKSSQEGYETLEFYSGNREKVFYSENDGGYLVCGNNSYNLASGQVQPFKRYLNPYLKLETYWESLVLIKGYGARDLRSFP